jgi:D-alanyl-D-alanine dipeptidase
MKRHRTNTFFAAAVMIGGMLLAGLSIETCARADTPPMLSPATTTAQAGLLDIRHLVPDMAEDIKYAGSDNFVGRPVAGYGAAKCLLLKPAAEALARVENELRREHLRLKLFDCYRPARAVADFVRWAHDLSDQRTKAAHYPLIGKDQLLGTYIAPVSGHSRGATVDLTLMQCNGSGKQCRPLDMGTHFDYFGILAHTDAAVTPAQHANRLRLRDAMQRGGFSNYPLEWWHYTLQPEPTPDTIYDLPID